jgi:hypothetical protein
VRQKVFFFSDYQGTRQIQGTDTGLIPVPSLQDRTGNLSDQASSLTGTVSGAYWANLLSQKLGYPVSAGEPYYTSPGCTAPRSAFFRTQHSAERVVRSGLNLLKYIPAPNLPGNEFSTSAYNQILRDDKIGERIDANTRWGTIFGYYSFDNYTENNPYPTAQGGANVPGFNGLYTGRAQLFDIGYTKTLGTSAVNEFHISYTRDANDLGKPAGGLGVSLASQGFVTGAGTLGIVPGRLRAWKTLSSITSQSGPFPISSTRLTTTSVERQFFQSAGNALDQIRGPVGIRPDQHASFADLNGSFNFNGTETGVDFADFLLGISSQYTQNQLGRSTAATSTWASTRRTAGA